jgi:dATP pyrophosphohydrolase
MSKKRSIDIRSNGVVVFVCRLRQGQAEYLLLRRTDERGGFWQQVSGGVEVGESAWQAANREVIEETGLRPTALYSTDEVEMFYQLRRDRISVSPGFVAFVAGEGPVQLSHEHVEWRWVSLEQARQLLVFPRQIEMLETVQRQFILKPPNERLRIPLDGPEPVEGEGRI